MRYNDATLPPAPNALRTRRLVPVAAAIMCAGLATPAFAQVTENVLLDFDGTFLGGPAAPLLADTSGPSDSLRALYGTTVSAEPCQGTICYGSVFKLMPPKGGKTNWKESTLETFPKGGNGPLDPYYGGLFTFRKKITASTPLFGAGQYGGNSGCTSSCGVVYSLTGHTLGTVYDFTGGADGSNPTYGGLIGDRSGALYITTFGGGGSSGCGTVDKLTPPMKGKTAWTETTLWEFTGGNDGCYPSALLFEKTGTLYGVAGDGGSSNNGTFFTLTPPAKGKTAWTETTLYSFAGGNDASVPVSIAAGKNGDLYGVSYNGGGFGTYGAGTVFALTAPKKGQTAWKEKVLWSFTGGADGSQPNPPLIIDKAGSIYGTAAAGGDETGSCNAGCGTAFKLTPPSDGQGAWTETTLYAFSLGADGGVPQAGLTPDKSGVLYGTTYGGGTYGITGAGVVYSLTGTGFIPQ